MSNSPDSNRIDHQYPEEDYVTMRRHAPFSEENYEAMRRPSAYTDTPSQSMYVPISEPAWSKHEPSHGVKAARFKKLQQWDTKSKAITQALAWGLVAAGAAGAVSIAGPVLQQLPR